MLGLATCRGRGVGALDAVSGTRNLSLPAYKEIIADGGDGPHCSFISSTRDSF
jgi:hypothetical protein